MSARIFFDQYRWIMFFCWRWLMFSSASKWKDAGVGRNTTSVAVERKNLADLNCKFFREHPTKKIPYSKKIFSASVCKKNAQCRLKNIYRGFTTTDVGYCIFYSIPDKYLDEVYEEMFDRRHPVMFLIYKSMIGHLSWSTSASNFFDQYRWIMFFCRRLLMFSSASQWKRWRCPRKHNFGWAQTWWDHLIQATKVWMTPLPVKEDKSG